MSNFKSPFWITVFYIIPGVSIIGSVITGLKGELSIFLFLGMAFPAMAWLGRLMGYCFSDDLHSCPKCGAKF